MGPSRPRRLPARRLAARRAVPSATLLAVLGAGALFLLTACAGAPGPNDVAHSAAGHVSGFWAGLWHGIIMPITFVVSLFSDNVNIYDVHNNGGWYNFGFVLGAGVLLGGGGRGGAHARRRRET